MPSHGIAKKPLEHPLECRHVGIMSDLTSRRSPYRIPVLIGAALLVVGGAAAAWMSWDGRPADVAVAPECRASQAVAQRLAPLATGEVAAVAATTRPALPPEVTFQGPAGEAMSLADFN